MIERSPETSQRDVFLESEGDAYELRNVGAEPDRDFLGALAIMLQPGQSVLEIGCGSGGNLRYLERLVPGVSCSGLDPSSAAIQEARRRSPSFQLAVGTADAIPFTGAFDAVLFGFCLYLCDRALLFRIAMEADRALKGAELGGGGLLAILDFDPVIPHRRRYSHDSRLATYKMDYSRLFLANPSYRLLSKTQLPLAGTSGRASSSLEDRVAFWVMRKNEDDAYLLRS